MVPLTTIPCTKTSSDDNPGSSLYWRNGDWNKVVTRTYYQRWHKKL